MVDRTASGNIPAPEWITPIMWDSINEMDKLPGFTGFLAAIQQGLRDWKTWYMNGTPEEEPLPGEWATKCSEMQKLCIVRALRIDRLLFAATKFISSNILVPNIYV